MLTHWLCCSFFMWSKGMTQISATLQQVSPLFHLSEPAQRHLFQFLTPNKTQRGPNVCFLCDTASKDLARGPNSGSRISRPPPATCEPQLQPETTTQIPKSMSAAPFLKVGLTLWSAGVQAEWRSETWPLSTSQHSALTPAQKDYLYSLTASYSSAHVRNLITQHYLNVLHRRVRTGEEGRGRSVGWSWCILGVLYKHRSVGLKLISRLALTSVICDITVSHCTACLVELWSHLKLYCSPVFYNC